MLGLKWGGSLLILVSIVLVHATFLFTEQAISRCYEPRADIIKKILFCTFCKFFYGDSVPMAIPVPDFVRSAGQGTDIEDTYLREPGWDLTEGRKLLFFDGVG